jgi:FlaG/FlaF family flagellin (archaellin)
MLHNTHFYNRTIRKVVVAFGTIFNDIYLVRYTQDGITPKEKFKVPISYGSKEKYLTRITSDPTLTKSIQIAVPRISFELTNLTYDASRKKQTTMQNFAADTSSALKTQYFPVPYNYDFSMSIYVRNTEDGAEILEQILPFFTPDFNVTVNFISAMDQKYDVPVVLNSVTNQTEYEGDFMSTRLIIWNLEFTAKGYIWPAVVSAPLINQANTNIFIDNQTVSLQKVYVDYANGNGTFAQSETIRVNNRDVIGSLYYFSNDSTGVFVAEGLNKLLQVGDVIVGDISNATYTVTSLDKTPIKAFAVVTTPDPANATPDSEFGFAESLTEYPNTIV